MLGDIDGDGIITAIDRQSFSECSLLGFAHGCEIFDFDGDCDLDADDLYLLDHKASDLNGDGVVGAADIAIMLGAWGTPNQACDLSSDGSVGADDLAILLGMWG